MDESEQLVSIVCNVRASELTLPFQLPLGQKHRLRPSCTTKRHRSPLASVPSYLSHQPRLPNDG